MVVLLYFFYPSRYQVGDTIYEGKYFDSAYDAYNDDDTLTLIAKLRKI